MRDVCTYFAVELREFNGATDHVHLLVHYPPKVALSRLVGSLKGVSTRRLRQEFPAYIRKYLSESIGRRVGWRPRPGPPATGHSGHRPDPARPGRQGHLKRRTRCLGLRGQAEADPPPAS